MTTSWGQYIKKMEISLRQDKESARTKVLSCGFAPNTLGPGIFLTGVWQQKPTMSSTPPSFWRWVGDPSSCPWLSQKCEGSKHISGTMARNEKVPSFSCHHPELSASVPFTRLLLKESHPFLILKGWARRGKPSSCAPPPSLCLTSALQTFLKLTHSIWSCSSGHLPGSAVFLPGPPRATPDRKSVV